MEVNVEELNDKSGWTVEAIGDDGEVYKANFYGPRAEQRAKEYADFCLEPDPSGEAYEPKEQEAA